MCRKILGSAEFEQFALLFSIIQNAIEVLKIKLHPKIPTIYTISYQKSSIIVTIETILLV